MTAGRHAALLGGTASGKSGAAMAIARRDPAWELVSVDSMQVYRGMDIGTAKPTPAERAEIPHHLVDVADPADEYDVAQFQEAARAAIADIESRGRRALLVGGTALYLRAVVDDLDLPGRFPDVRADLDAAVAAGTPVEDLHRRLTELDPDAAARMEPTNERRVVRALEVTLGSGRRFSSYGPGLDQHRPTPFTLVAITWERTDLDARIDRRYDEMMRAGFLDEVRALTAPGHTLSRSAAQALGYKELAGHLRGDLPLTDAVDLAKLRTRRFSRRQEKWFRRDPRIVGVDGRPDGPGDGALRAVHERIAAAIGADW